MYVTHICVPQLTSLLFLCSSISFTLFHTSGVRSVAPYDIHINLEMMSSIWKSSADMASLSVCLADTKSSCTTCRILRYGKCAVRVSHIYVHTLSVRGVTINVQNTYTYMFMGITWSVGERLEKVKTNSF